MRDAAGRVGARRRCRGLAIVEYTIVVPICLMLVVATAEFGRAFWQYNTLTKAVRDGARHAAGHALQGSTGTVSISGSLSTETRNLVVYGRTIAAGSPLLPGLTTGQVSVTDAGAGTVAVTATYPYSPIFAFVPRFSFGSNVNTSSYTLQVAVTMRAL